MKRYISIYNEYCDAVDFAVEKGWITEAEAQDENLDLLSFFEGDPDVLYVAKDCPVFFMICGDTILTTAEETEDTELLDSWIRDTAKWNRVDAETSRDTPRIYFRGGCGYVYNIYEKE